MDTSNECPFLSSKPDEKPCGFSLVEILLMTGWMRTFDEAEIDECGFSE